MNHFAKIRAALEQEPGASRGQALAALAELERAAKEHAGIVAVKPSGNVYVAWKSICMPGTKLYTTPPPAQPAPGMPEWYGEGTPWPLHEVLAKLTNATGILLDRLDYDGHGHEGIRYAQIAGKEILAKITQERTK